MRFGKPTLLLHQHSAEHIVPVVTKPPSPLSLLLGSSSLHAVVKDLALRAGISKGSLTFALIQVTETIVVGLFPGVARY